MCGLSPNIITNRLKEKKYLRVWTILTIRTKSNIIFFTYRSISDWLWHFPVSVSSASERTCSRLVLLAQTVAYDVMLLCDVNSFILALHESITNTTSLIVMEVSAMFVDSITWGLRLVSVGKIEARSYISHDGDQVWLVCDSSTRWDFVIELRIFFSFQETAHRFYPY